MQHLPLRSRSARNRGHAFVKQRSRFGEITGHDAAKYARMRKKSKRTLRPVVKPLTAKQKADIIIAPRMHLQMLLAGQYDVDYACSLAGVFNLSGVLSHMYERNDLEQTFDLAQEIIVCLIREGRAPTGDEGQSLAEAFNLADAWITMQNTVNLMKAVDYMDRELVKKDWLGDVNAVG